MMDGKTLKSKLKNGEKVYGTLIVSTSPKWLDVIDKIGLDFVFIDTEHIPIDRDRLSWMCHGYQGKGLVPIVRIPSPDPYLACMVIDGGARGVVAPYLETAEDVRQLSGAVKIRPIKGKKLQNHLNGTHEFEPALQAYLTNHNEQLICIANIESRSALENLDEILAVPGLDVVLIGPHDLSCNLGIPEQYDHPDFLNAVETIITKARTAGVGAGIHVFFDKAIAQERQWMQMGANFVLHSGDINRFTQAMREDIHTLRSEMGDTIEITTSQVNI
jgi:2-keto-3-deoxy-L-rhamnonate aldolase RhmA